MSFSDRSPCATLDEALDRFQHAFVDRTVAILPELAAEADDWLLLSAAVEALGLDAGHRPPRAAGPDLSPRPPPCGPWSTSCAPPASPHTGSGSRSRRYRRWLAVNPEPTVEARGKMLGELWGTYRLGEVEAAWPDTRVRFFRHTVFADARPELAAALDMLVQRARTAPIGGGDLDLEAQVAPVRGAAHPTAEEDYFLARMTYRYLAPTDEVALISMPAGGHFVTEVVVALTDEAGERYTVRGPVSPREVARLLQLFHESNLQVTFAAEHEFLLCLDAQEAVIGGLYYRQVAPDRVHMEKVTVVSTGTAARASPTG